LDLGSSDSDRYLSFFVVPESFAHNDIAPAFDRREFITGYPYQPGYRAPTIANVLDHELTTSLYSLSDGGTFLETGSADIDHILTYGIS